MASPRNSTRPKKARKPLDPLVAAVAHLRACDPRWTPILDEVGPCRLELHPDRFGTLVRAIIGQQISAKAASSIDKRLRTVAGPTHRPDALLAQGETGLRSVGLSGVKARYILNLSQASRDGLLPLDEIHLWEDDAIVDALTTVKGIGAWTAEMFLVFALGRPDVLSVGDLGIRVGIRNFYGLAAMPTPKECRDYAEPWRPYRSIAMWYLWQQVDAPRVKKTEAQAEEIAEEVAEREIIAAD